MLLLILGCMGCCCGGVPLFGLWPRLDDGPVEAALRGQPLVVDHACSPDVVCDAVLDVDATVYPLSYSLISGQISTLVEVEATCAVPTRQQGSRLRTVACAGTLGAVYEAADDGWALSYVTESTAGTRPSGQGYDGPQVDDDDD